MENSFRDYKIDRVIGNGAFGQVYRIIREEFGHTYEAALKIIELPKDMSEVEAMLREGMSKQNVAEYYESVVEEIVREFELMSKLKGNSYIVSYEDHKVVKKEDTFGWKIYIQMELLTPLLVHIEEKGMTYHDVLHMGIDICKAMELCQKYKIIHRDIKPENIFVSSNGDFKLGDFGIARQLDQTNSNLSQKGTKNYMAPEIFRGTEYDATVDIYSLGIVLYRFFNSNRIPFLPQAPLPIHFSDKENAMTRRLAGESMPKPTEASDNLAQIILKACAFCPGERYQEPKQLREALEQVMQEEEDRLLLRPIKEEFPEEPVSDAEKLQEDEEKTVILLPKNDQTDMIPPPSNIVQDDETVPLSMLPQKKNNRLKFIVGGLVIAFALVFLLVVTAFWQPKKSSNTTTKEKVTELPKTTATVTPVVTVPPTEKPTAEPTGKPTPKPTKKPTPKPTRKPTPKPTKKPTSKPTSKPVIQATVKPTEVPSRMTPRPRRTENVPSQDVIDIKPNDQDEIIIQ